MRKLRINTNRSMGVYEVRSIQSAGHSRYIGIVLFLCALFNLKPTFSQQSESNLLFPDGRPEVYFKFIKPSKLSMQDISYIISIDKRKGDTVFAYASVKQINKFQKLNVAFEILTAPSLQNKVRMTENAKGMQTWDSYPTYSAYIQMMQDFANNYPSLCHLDTIGTSVNGHLILFLEISNHPQAIEAKTEFMYSSTMHGNEPTTYVVILRLIDYLLSNYGTDSLVTRLVNNLHIWINPLANPDGTYFGGDNTVNGATRYFTDGVDANRNFPDPAGGPHPDGEVWQKENIAMMNFMQKHRFAMSANLHTGAEVVNYPWDTWYKRHPDDAWLQYVSKEFADSAQFYGPAGYYTDVSNDGYIDGWDWYTIEGGRQDYMTYFMHGREVTLEFSETKTPATSSLPDYWDANYRSLLHYMEESTFGLHGIISDSANNTPLRAKIEALNHDFDHSEVYSDSITGYYTRLIAGGTYDFLVSAPGYYSKLYRGVSIINHKTSLLNIKLQSASANKFPPVLKDNNGKVTDSLIIDLKPDSVKNNCLLISDPENQSAWIDTILTENENISVTFTKYENCLTLSSANGYQGSTPLKIVLCDNGNPALCDTATIIARVNNIASLVENESQANSLFVYPNPFNDQIIIHINNDDKSEKNIRLIDLTAKECLNEKFRGTEDIISTNQLRQGIYLLQIYSDTGMICSLKLIKLM